jgi:hypothetical protein
MYAAIQTNGALNIIFRPAFTGNCMLSKTLLKNLHARGVKYTFKLPLKRAEEKMSDIIRHPENAIESMLRDKWVRLPFGAKTLHCFYPDNEILVDVDGKPESIIQAVCAYQQEDNTTTMLTIFDENGEVIVHEGGGIHVWLCYDKKVHLIVRKITDSEVDVVSFDDLPEKILARIGVALRLVTVSLYAMNFRETKEIVSKQQYRKSVRESKNKPTDYKIQISRKKYLLPNYVLSCRKGIEKRPHTRRGTWCHAKSTGKKWWRNACKIHGGGGDQDYKL